MIRTYLSLGMRNDRSMGLGIAIESNISHLMKHLLTNPDAKCGTLVMSLQLQDNT